MKTYITFFALLLFGTARAQNENWQHSSSWALYNIHNSHAFFWPLDTLKHFNSSTLDDTIIHNFLIAVSPVEKTDEPVWMGLYVAACTFDDSVIHKIDISVYGGFFLDEHSKTYFKITEAYKKQWQNYFHDQMVKLDTGK